MKNERVGRIKMTPDLEYAVFTEKTQSGGRAGEEPEFDSG